MSDTRIVTVKTMVEDGIFVEYEMLVEAKFTCFDNLPNELQAKVLKYAAADEDPRAVTIFEDKNSPSGYNLEVFGMVRPNITVVSKAITQILTDHGIYKVVFQFDGSDKSVFFNPKLDKLAIKSLVPDRPLALAMVNTRDLEVVKSVVIKDVVLGNIPAVMVLLKSLRNYENLSIQGDMAEFCAPCGFPFHLSFCFYKKNEGDDGTGDATIFYENFCGKRTVGDAAMNEIFDEIQNPYERANIIELEQIVKTATKTYPEFPRELPVVMSYY